MVNVCERLICHNVGDEKDTIVWEAAGLFFSFPGSFRGRFGGYFYNLLQKVGVLFSEKGGTSNMLVPNGFMF